MATYTYTQPLASFESTLSDVALGTELDTDHDRIPAGVSLVFGPTFDGTCFAIKDNLLYYCKPKQPEYWPALYYIEASTTQQPLQTGLIHGGQVYVMSKSYIHRVTGTGNNIFVPFQLDTKTGAQSLRGAVSVSGMGIFHTGPDGIYLFSGSNDSKITESTLDPIFRGTTTNGILGVSTMDNSWLFQRANYLYFGYVSSGYTYPTNIIKFNLDTMRADYYEYNDGSVIEIITIHDDTANSRILVGDDTGFVRTIENKAYTDDSGTAISWELQSKEFTLPTRAHFPRWVKYDIDASSATSVTGTLLLDGTSHQTHTVTGNRTTKRRLVATGNGETASVKVEGTGVAQVFTVEFE